MPPKQREMSYSEGLYEGSPNRPGGKNLSAADLEKLQNNISQLVTDFNQLKTSGVDKQEFEKVRSDVLQLTTDRLDPQQFAKASNDIQQLITDSAGTQRFQSECTKILDSITTTAKNLRESLVDHVGQFKVLKDQVQEIADAVRNLGEPPSKQQFDILLSEVRGIDEKVDTLNQTDSVNGGRPGEDNADIDNNGTGSIHVHEGPENDLTDNQYRRFPQNVGSNLPAIRGQAAQGGGQTPASLRATSQTHTHGSQRTQAAAKDEQFWVHIKLWEINRAGGRIRGGQELMPIKLNSTLRDLEIQIENYVKKLQKGDISKRANLQEPNVFYWSTEHVVDNIKAMKDMDADENMWSSNQGDGGVIINENNEIGVMDMLKREQQMPWLSVTIKLKDTSER
jgi:hypothetical protein